MNWMGIIDRGGELPDRDSPLYKGFVKSWRGWFKTYCNLNGNIPNDVVAYNKYCYDVGKEHLESLGMQITDDKDYNKERGTVQTYFPKEFGHADDKEVERAFSFEVETS